ncbi:hypothetical protein CYMTET_15893 [Cymbomonas tetramitiformis]|uniref:Rab-GAP TBC domain-containing protein n=1 Tax=Cymbomonas tetramitiformis TaxID=36881 RepID=A0AAE0GDN1_9CHLO|nr:hypothetical protein CYMTET_15893 [Cymbomonas tetramitiformis]
MFQGFTHLVQWVTEKMGERTGRSEPFSPEEAARLHRWSEAAWTPGVATSINRAQDYLELSGASLKKAQAPPGYYESLLEGLHDANTLADQGLCKPLACDSSPQMELDLRDSLVDTWRTLDESVMKEIEKDVRRIGEGEMAPELVQWHRGSLRRVLRAYACGHNRSTGYCQSLSPFVWTLLKVMLSEEDVFWVLAALVDDRLCGYTTYLMHGLRLDLELLGTLAARRTPRLTAFLASAGVNLEAYTGQWLLTLFGGIFPEPLALRVMDLVLLEGRTALLAVALGFLRCAERAILETVASVPSKDLKSAGFIYATSVLSCRGDFSVDSTMLIKMAYIERRRMTQADEDLRLMQAAHLKQMLPVFKTRIGSILQHLSVSMGSTRLAADEAKKIAEAFLANAMMCADNPELYSIKKTKLPDMILTLSSDSSKKSKSVVKKQVSSTFDSKDGTMCFVKVLAVIVARSRQSAVRYRAAHTGPSTFDAL